MDDMFNLEKRTYDVLRAVRLFLSTIGAAPVTSLWVRRNVFQDIEIGRDDFALDYEFIAVGPLFDSIQYNKDYLLSERGYVRGHGIRDPQRDLSQRWKDAQVSFHDMNAFKDVWIQDIDFRSMPPSSWGGKPLRGYIKVWDASTGTTRMDNPRSDIKLEKHLASVLKKAEDFLELLGEGEIESIWLIGSRAEGTAKRDSDWDFLIVGEDFNDVEEALLDMIEGDEYTCGINLDSTEENRHLSEDIIFSSDPPSKEQASIKLWDCEGGFLQASLPRNGNPSKSTATRTDEGLWRRTVSKIKAGTRGGNAGQWSARKAQLAVSEYKKAGGGYIGAKSPSNSLTRWTNQKWRTKSGLPSLRTGERYLPEKAIAALTEEEYKETSRAKRKGIKGGRQFAPQPLDIAAKTAKYRR